MKLFSLEVWDEKQKLGDLDPITHMGGATAHGYMRTIRFYLDGIQMFEMDLNEPHAVVTPADTMNMSLANPYEVLIQTGYGMFKLWDKPGKLIQAIRFIEAQANECQTRIAVH